MRRFVLPALIPFVVAGIACHLAGCRGENRSSADPSSFTRQFGTAGDDWAYGIAVEGTGNVAVVGQTSGVLEPGHVPTPGGEIFLGRFDPSGKMLWARQFAPGSGNGVAADSGGNLYVVGTSGADVLLAKFDPAGNKLWQFLGGTPETDSGEAITVGPDNTVYVTGRTGGAFETGGPNRGGTDIFVAKFSPTDNVPVWVRQLGSQGQDFVDAIATDNNGFLYIAGMALGGFEGNTWNGGEDVVLVKLSADNGSLIWARQYGTTDDEYGSGVTIDGNGNAYVLGYTDADFDGSGIPAEDVDLFLIKVDPANGNPVWTVQRRSPGFDQAEGLAHAGERLVIAGSTRGDLGGPNAGGSDAFLLSFDLSGALQWARQLGTGSSEEIWGLAAGRDGNWYSAGSTTGRLRPGETSAGGHDAFLIKVDSSGTPR